MRKKYKFLPNSGNRKIEHMHIKLISLILTSMIFTITYYQTT